MLPHLVCCRLLEIDCSRSIRHEIASSNGTSGHAVIDVELKERWMSSSGNKRQGGGERTRDPERYRVHAGNALYMRSKREQEREYMRTCRTMAVISFTSSELEDYQLQLVLRSVDQIASQFVHRLFFLAPPSSSSSCSYHPLSPISSPRAHRLSLSNLAPYCGPSTRSRSTVRDWIERGGCDPKCHVGFSPNCRNRVAPSPIWRKFTRPSSYY